MKFAKVAVITRTRNRPVLLKRAIESVLGQAFQDWVMVVVNDGGESTEVDALLDGYREDFGKRLELIHNPTSIGMEAASNKGIKSVDSEFVVIHDDDDSWHPSFLQRCMDFFDDNPFPESGYPAHGVITYSIRCLERIVGSEVIVDYTEPYNSWLTSISLSRMAAGNVFSPISFVFRRKVFDEIGYYREDLPVLGDWDFNLRFSAKYEIGLIREELAYYHHRLAIDDGEYGNSVIKDDSLHRFYETLLCNEYLRKDMENNRVGIGFMASMGRSFEIVHHQLTPIEFLSNALRKSRLVRWLYKLIR